MRKKRLILTIVSMSFSSLAFAAHPLSSDDTGTQGKGKAQIELTGEYVYDDGDESSEKKGEIATALCYGVTDEIDVIFGTAYQQIVVAEAGPGSRRDGLSDTSVEVKWRLYEQDSLSLALKPGITFPSGDEERGFGNGRIAYSFTGIVTKEMGFLVFHLNAGYGHDEYRVQVDRDANRKDIWNVSLGVEYEVLEDLELVGDLGMERNSDRASNRHPSFAILGFIYSVSENFDIDLGVKIGLNDTEADYAVLAGCTWRF